MNRDIQENAEIDFWDGFWCVLGLVLICLFIFFSFKAVWTSFPTDEQMKARKDLVDYCRSDDIKKLKVGDLPAKCLTFYAKGVL